MHSLDSSPLIMFAFAAGIVAQFQWLGLGCFLFHRMASLVALCAVMLLAVVALVFAGVQFNGNPKFMVPVAVVDIGLKAVLTGVLCRRVGWRRREACVLFASLVALALLIIPWVCLELSNHFFFSQGRPEVHEIWEARAWATVYFRVVCDCFAITAFYRLASSM